MALPLKVLLGEFICHLSTGAYFDAHKCVCKMEAQFPECGLSWLARYTITDQYPALRTVIQQSPTLNELRSRFHSPSMTEKCFCRSVLEDIVKDFQQETRHVEEKYDSEDQFSSELNERFPSPGSPHSISLYLLALWSVLVDKNLEAGHLLYNESHELGCVFAKNALGLRLLSDTNRQSNLKCAANLFAESASLANPHALTHLADCLDHGLALSDLLPKHERLIHAIKSSQGMSSLTHEIWHGMLCRWRVVQKDSSAGGSEIMEETIESDELPTGSNELDEEVPHLAYRIASDLGCPSARYQILSRYSPREDQNSDVRALYSALQSAAEFGHPDVQCDLAHFYYYGQSGSTKDNEMAASFLQKAAQQGHALSIHTLSEIYFNGRSVPLDIAQAVELLTAEVQLGYTEADISLSSI